MQLTHIINKIKSEKAYFFGIPVPLHYILLVLLIIVIFYGIRSWTNQDKWGTLVHEPYGFSVDYPANWGHELYGERGEKGVQNVKAIATSFPFGPVGPKMGFTVHWLAMDDPSLEKAAKWGVDILPPYSGTLSDLQETVVGIGHYPALTRNFYYDDSSAMEAYYYVIRENGTYILEFYLKDEDDIDEVRPVFNHMLASFKMLDWSE